MTERARLVHGDQYGHAVPPPSNPVATEIPEELAAHRGRPLLVATVGALGGRTVLLTDLPAIYVHESGGLLRQERVRTYEGYDLKKEEIVFSKRSTAVKGALELNGIGRLQFETDRYTHEVASGLVAASPSLITALPVSVNVDLVETRVAKKASLLKARAAAEDTSPAWMAIDELFHHDELYAHVEVEGETLVLTKKGTPIGVIPLGDHVVLDATTIRVHARVNFAELPVSSMTVHLPAGAAMDRLGRMLDRHQSVADEAPAGDSDAAPAADESEVTTGGATIGTVAMTGSLGDGDFRRSGGQLVVDDEHLALTVDGSSHRFRFDDPELRVSGGSQDLILSDGDDGPVLVSDMGEELQGHLAEHDRLRSAANRTIDLGPYPCQIDGRVAIIDVADGVITGRTSGANHADRSTVEMTVADLGPPVVASTADGVELTLTAISNEPGAVVSGSLPVMAEIYRRLRLDAASRRSRDDAKRLLPAITALEGDCLLYTVIGPVVEAHRFLLVSHGVYPSDEEALTIPIPEPWPNATELLGSILVDAATQVEQHLERVLHQLPAFLTANDSNVDHEDHGKRLPPLAIKALEPRYRAALAPLRLLVGHVSAVHEPLRSALAVLGVDTAPSYGSALLTGVAGAVVNPVFLISSASQVLGAKKSVGRIAEEKQGSAMRAVQRATDRWNRLVLQTSPDIVGPVLDGLFPLRWKISRYYAARLDSEDDEERAATHQHLLRRLATLEAFLAMPAPGSKASSRRSLVDAVHRQVVTAGAAEHFTPF